MLLDRKVMNVDLDSPVRRGAGLDDRAQFVTFPLSVGALAIQLASAARLAHGGLRATVISKLLGHSSVTVTRYLDHLTNHQAVTALGNAELLPLPSRG
jgi:integrase